MSDFFDILFSDGSAYYWSPFFVFVIAMTAIIWKIVKENKVINALKQDNIEEINIGRKGIIHVKKKINHESEKTSKTKKK